MQESCQENVCTGVELLSRCMKCMQSFVSEELKRHSESLCNQSDQRQALFIRSLNNISDQETQLGKINVLLNLNDELKIHPLAFSQLSKEYQTELLSVTRKLNADGISIKDFLDDKNEEFTKCLDIRKHYKILLDSEITYKLFYIANKLHIATETDLNSFLIDGKAIFAKIKPFEIQRVYQLFHGAFREKDHFIKAGIKFAQYEKVTNIADFCAVCEFAVIQLKEESGGAKPKRRSAVRKNAEIELANGFTENASKQKEYSDLFTKLKGGCSSHGLQFVSPHCEVTHFLKHCKDDKNFKTLNFSTAKEYVGFLGEKKTECFETFITQEGTNYFCLYNFPVQEKTYTLQIIADAFSRKETIVTAY
uniref:Uncharacterized protein n=1 Tax=Biomphalaria glabrata TaxID=6526 RepID=A0A2C9L3Z9_BIOGL